MKRAIYGRKMLPAGKTPAIALINPKNAHNVGAVVRLASCYGIGQVWFTGNRVTMDPSGVQRLPREERMKGYRDVELRQHDYFLEQYSGKRVTPVAVEIREDSERLMDFVHPEDALYVFGPEDGNIPKVILQHCHRFLVIPSRHCLNLAVAVGTVIYDRAYKRYLATGETLTLAEHRGYEEPKDSFDLVASDGRPQAKRRRR